MKPDLKRLEDQTIVITGASSGIGLTTARMAAGRGARLVLAARREGALEQLTEEIKAGGGQAAHVAADVSKQEDVRRIARAADDAFGGFDTWINVAGVFIYGKLEEVPIEDMRKLFETNVWGLIYGSLEAVRHLKRKGGALINIGSVLSERAILLQGIYSASKHAVKGFTEALRMELEQECAPVSVSLIKPSSIDTPYPRHAKNYMEEVQPQVPPPVYAPETVARAILHCAEHPKRDVVVGAGGKSLVASGYYAPRLTDKIMEKVFAPLEKKNAPPRPREENSLDGPAGRLEERGGYEGHVAETSLYTGASLHPMLTGAALAGAGLAAAWWSASRDGARGVKTAETRRTGRKRTRRADGLHGNGRSSPIHPQTR